MKKNRCILILVAIGLVVLAALLLPPIQSPKVRGTRVNTAKNSVSITIITNAMATQQSQTP